ncbi:carbohydrate kinase family protein [Kineococcus rhizosphaerae]|uniref:carbohydrate kinase family protein n=1 Tax=Kineococcus rhizosphaerae TaxID=559628 RepID=UPI001473C711|nr:PfkB family carbohydrate kinase [Kineococcus rhizosphaerae]
MSADLDVLLGGRLFCDLVFSGSSLPRPGAEVFADGFVLSPGGTANRAVAAARLGGRTGLFAVLGRDVFGDEVARLLAREPHLDLTWLQRSDTVRTAVTVAVTDEHDRSFITYEEDGTEVPRTWPGELPTAATCHVGLAADLPGWVATLRAAGTTVFGGVGWDPSHEWSPTVLDRLAQVDVFVPNEVEATSYTRTDDALAAAKLLAERVGTVVVTRGPLGSLAIDATGTLVTEPAPAVPVVDPTGAGDVFVAGLMTATRLSWDLRNRLRFAGLVASLSVRGLGGAASAPGPADVLRFLEDSGPREGYDDIHDWALDATRDQEEQ